MPIEQRVFLKSDDDEIFKYVSFNSTLPGDFETSSFFIFDRNRHDLCVSCMAGCPMGCLMCSTTFAEMPFERALSPDEMLAQIVTAIENRAPLSNASTELRIGFMGNGEPFRNLDAVLETMRRVQGAGIRVGNFIVSTIGVEALRRAGELLTLTRETGIPVKLQYSLFSLDEDMRRQLLPAAQPLASSLSHLDAYAAASGIPVRYNIPLMAGFNDSQEHLQRLADFAREQPELRRLKLAVYNRFPGSPFFACPDEQVYETGVWFEQQGVKVDLFFGNRNDALYASCGQMRAQTRPSGESALQKDLVIASKNPEKRQLIEQIARAHQVRTFFSPEITGTDFDIAETGATYLENALLKATHVFQLTHIPTIADDYGMEIRGLDGAPGIYTRQEGEERSEDAALLAKTIALARSLPPKARTCDFVGAGVLIYAPGKYLAATETDHGVLLTEPRGPLLPGHPLASLLLIPERNKTLAELKAEGYASKDARIYEQLLRQYRAL